MNLQTPIARFYEALDRLHFLESHKIDCERAAGDLAGTDDAHAAIAEMRACEAKDLLAAAKTEALVLATNLIDAMVAREERRAA